MKILFIGGDKRQLEIIKHYANMDTTIIGYSNINVNNIKKIKINDVKISEYDIIIFPVSGVGKNYVVNTSFDDDIYLDKNFFVNSKRNVLIFTGIMTENLKEMLENANRKANILMEDQQVIKENSIPTIEGIIGDIILNTEITINKASILVVGYGNIGSLLVNYLEKLGANVMIGVIKEEDYLKLTKEQKIVSYTNKSSEFNKIITKADIIINTVPSLVLNQVCLNHVNPNTYILDVASYPYGIDLKIADDLKLNYKLFPGIPGKVAPKTAGNILCKKITDVIKKELII